MQLTAIAHPKIVTRNEWLRARKKLLIQEKALTRRRDVLNANRRRLPMVRVDKPYVFEGPEGKVALLDLFDGRRQLIVYHFMFDPNDPPTGKSGAPWDEGCPACSSIVDSFGDLSHLRARDTNLVVVSRAPQSKIQPFKARMGWTVPWYSSFGSEFNYDFHVTNDEDVAPVEYNFKDKWTLQRQNPNGNLPRGEQPGLSVFLRLDDEVYHTYSTYGRGLEPLFHTYTFLDLTPYGRQESWEDSPEGWPQSPTYPTWMLHHDKYVDSDEKHQGSGGCCHGAADRV